MKSPLLNFIINALLFAGVSCLAASGILMHFVLPPGSGRLESGGFDRGAAQRMIGTVWGLDRHQWGEIHFWIAVGTVTVLVVHLAFHWRWIVGTLRNNKVVGTAALAVIAALLFLAAALLVSGKKLVPRTPQEERSDERAAGRGPGGEHRGEGAEPLRMGRMTLEEVAAECNVPVGYLVERLGLPRDVPIGEQLARLRMRLGLNFTMQDVARVAAEYRQEKPSE